MMIDETINTAEKNEKDTTEEKARVYIPITEYNNMFVGIKDKTSLRKFLNDLDEHVNRAFELNRAATIGFKNKSIPEEGCIKLVDIALYELISCRSMLDKVM